MNQEWAAEEDSVKRNRRSWQTEAPLQNAKVVISSLVDTHIGKQVFEKYVLPGGSGARL